jgi:solute:Na+ symporter, SSS family
MKAVFLATILFYILILWVLGWLASKRSKGSEGYLVASRGFSALWVSALVAGTWVGGVSVVGMAQGAFLHGLSAIWFQVGIWVAMCVTAALLPKIIKGKKTYSILDIVARSYDLRTAHLAGLFHLIFTIGGVTMNIVGGGAILSFILKETLTLSQGMALTAAVFCLYVVQGGIVATAYTSLAHLITIFCGITLGGIYLVNEFGGTALLRASLPPFYFQPLGDLGLWKALSWFIVNLTLGVLAQPVINAAASAKDLHHGRVGILMGTVLAIPVPCIAAFCGIMARSRYPEMASVQALPILLPNLPLLLSLLFLLGMWAPVMSAGGAFLMGATTLIVRGYWVKRFPHLSDKGILISSRIATMCVTLVSLLFAFFVLDILQSLSEIAVLLSSVLILVLVGGVLRHPSKMGGRMALSVTLCLLILFIAMGWSKTVHPLWAVLASTLLIIGVSTWIERKRRAGEGQ